MIHDAKGHQDTAKGPATQTLHQVTFCESCGETIPAHAHSCFKCGTKQSHAEAPLQIVFCEKCGEDYPARAMSCYHCGHINPRHPYLTGGQISD